MKYIDKQRLLDIMIELDDVIKYRISKGYKPLGLCEMVDFNDSVLFGQYLKSCFPNKKTFWKWGFSFNSSFPVVVATKTNRDFTVWYWHPRRWTARHNWVKKQIKLLS